METPWVRLVCSLRLAVPLFSLLLLGPVPAGAGAIDELEGMTGTRIERPGGESDEERAERQRALAEWRAEQRALREEQRRQEAFALNEKGHVAYRARNWKAAVDCYRKAHRLNPADAVIRRNLRDAESAWAAEKAAAVAAARETAAREAEAKARARQKAREEKLARDTRERHQRELAAALARLQPEQQQLSTRPADWIAQHQGSVERRLREPNKWSKALAASLTTKAPPPPYKKLGELEPGDVLLVAPLRSDLVGIAINAADARLSGTKASAASHTVLYLKRVNGIRFYLDNVPGEGPRIVPEVYIMNKYGRRSLEVAKLAQPLQPAEGERLYAAAREMRAKNLARLGGNKWFDATTYGAWGKDEVVCAEADWALLRAAGRAIPASSDQLKRGLGLDFSPADFHGDRRYFLVTPLALAE